MVWYGEDVGSIEEGVGNHPWVLFRDGTTSEIALLTLIWDHDGSLYKQDWQLFANGSWVKEDVAPEYVGDVPFETALSGIQRGVDGSYLLVFEADEGVIST